jgi:hypothetical protein
MFLVCVIYYLFVAIQKIREHILKLFGPIYIIKCLKTHNNLTPYMYINPYYSCEGDFFIKVVAPEQTYHVTYQGNINDCISYLKKNIHRLRKIEPVKRKHYLLLDNTQTLRWDLSDIDMYVSAMDKLKLPFNNYSGTILKWMGYPCTHVKCISTNPIRVETTPIDLLESLKSLYIIDTPSEI